MPPYYRDKTQFPGNSTEIAKSFMIKISQYFSLSSQLFLRSCPQVTFTVSIIRYAFGSSLPACTVEHFRVHPNGDFSIYRYRE